LNVSSWWGKNKPAAETADEGEKVASTNPFKRGDQKKKDDSSAKPAAETAAKEPEADAKTAASKPKQDASDAKVATHDAETLKLIEEELKDASPAERERLYNEWKPLDSAMVKQVIGIRRMVRQMGQSAPQQQASQPAGSFGAGSFGATSPPAIDPAAAQLAGAGHSSTQFAHSAERAPVSPLGTNPWASPAGTETGERWPAQNPAMPGGDATRSFGSFSGVSPQQPGANPQVQLAAGTRFGTDGTNYPADYAAQQASFASYPTISPMGVTPVDPASRVGTDAAGMTITPRGLGQPPVGDAPQGFAGSVSTNGGPQIVAAAAPGGLSPYYPQGAPQNPAQPGGVMPASAQGADPSAARMVEPIPTQAAPSAGPAAGLSALGMGRFLNGNAGAAPASASTGHMSPVASRWGDDLQRLIANAGADAAQTPPGTTDAEKRNYVEKHVYLRMLYLMAGQQVRAMEPIPGIDPAEQEFWQQIFWGVSSYFDAEAIPDPLDRATQTTLQLRGALQRLQERARLELRNVNFCHKIASFGNYERFQRDEFSPGQPVLVYAEVSNFKSEQSADGPFRTILKSTIEIYNSRGDLIQTMPFPATEDLCQNQRRDYFHSYEFTIPQRIAIGPHVMKLTVEDQISQKVASYSLNFTVK